MKRLVVLAVIVLAMFIWPGRVGFRNELGSPESRAISALRGLHAAELMLQSAASTTEKMSTSEKAAEIVGAMARRGWQITTHAGTSGSAFVATPFGSNALSYRSFCTHDATVFSVPSGRPVEVADGRCVDTSTPVR